MKINGWYVRSVIYHFGVVTGVAAAAVAVGTDGVGSSSRFLWLRLIIFWGLLCPLRFCPLSLSPDSGICGVSLVTLPTALVRPSLKTSRCPTFKYSGCLTNLQEKRWFITLVESRIVDGIMAATIEEKTLNELTWNGSPLCLQFLSNRHSYS